MNISTILALALIAITATACSEPQRTVETLQSQGYTNVQVRNWTPLTLFQCSEDDNFRTPFTANSVKGTQVSGVACSGFLKGMTIRFD